MSLNTILSICEAVGIDDHKFVGQVMTRNMRISTSVQLSVQPFKFSMKPHNYLQYSTNRDVLSALRVADRAAEQYLNFGSTGWVNYIAYRGGLTSAQIINPLQWQVMSAGVTSLKLGNFPAGISSYTYVVRTGDFCQVGRYAYIATADVTRGAGVTVSIPVHRPLIDAVAAATNAVIGQYGTTVTLGGGTYTGVTFPVILSEYPTYSLIPMTNDSFIQWNGSFNAIESVL